MIDWYDTNPCHHREPNGHDRTNGRIFKISYENAKPVHGRSCTSSTTTNWSNLQLNRTIGMSGTPGEFCKSAEPIPKQHRRSWPTMAFDASPMRRAACGPCGRCTSPAAWTKSWPCRPCKTTCPRAGLDHSTGSRDDGKRDCRQHVLARFDDAGRQRRFAGRAAVHRLRPCSESPPDKRWEILSGLLAHAEDADDHNLPLMYWYAAEPLAEIDAARALKLAADGKIPLVTSFMVRRIAKIGTPEALDVLVGRIWQQVDDADGQLSMLAAINEGLKGRRQVPMPDGLAAVSARLMNSTHAEGQRRRPRRWR